MTDTDVLIVGGGLSGLALADQLARRGTDFLLVEAQDRLGGRIATHHVAGAAFDLGPTWFWPDQPRMATLAKRFAIPVFEQYSVGDMVYQDRAGTVERLSGYAAMQGSYRLAGGTGALIDALAEAIDNERILTGASLKTVRHSTGAINATLDRKGAPITISARQIVLAVAPRVIADTVQFEPPLDDAQTLALENIPTWMAGQAKVVAVYDTPHWRNAGLSGDAMSQRGPLIEIHDASQMTGGPFALFGFVGVPADAREAHKDDLTRLALDQLVALFGAEMSHPIDLVLQDWAACPTVARPMDRTPVRQHPRYGLPTNLGALSVNGIHFGATEAARGFGGFLEGALEAADDVASVISPR